MINLVRCEVAHVCHDSECKHLHPHKPIRQNTAYGLFGCGNCSHYCDNVKRTVLCLPVLVRLK